MSWSTIGRAAVTSPDDSSAYLYGQLRPVLLVYKQLIAEQISLQNTLATTAGDNANATYANTRTLLIGMSLAALAIAAALAYGITRSITGHMTQAMTDHYSHVDAGEKKVAVEGMLRLVHGGKVADAASWAHVHWSGRPDQALL